MSPRLRRLAGGAVTAALGLLGWHAYQPIHDAVSPVREITLWTGGAAGGREPAGPHTALPDATHAPPTAKRVPDAAYLRRAYPDLERVRIEGDGVDSADALALRGLAIDWRRPAAAGTTPELVQVAATRILAPGERLVVQGRVAGLPPAGTTTLSLEGPDGRTEAMVLRASPAGEAVFSLASGTPAIAPGAFAWRLRLGPDGEPLVLGAWVTPPELPRVLILQAAPTIEGGRLQRWLAGTGAAVTMRTRVSADHRRLVSANGGPEEVPRLDSAALAAFDAVVAFEAALGELSADERAELAVAVEVRGLGVLVAGGAGPESEDPAFSPWPVRPEDPAEAGSGPRLVRLRLAEGRELAEPVPAPPAELAAGPPGSWLVRDARDRMLGAIAPRGRGRLTRTLIMDTWRWLQGGHPETYAAYWSALLAATARPVIPAGGTWRLEAGTGPLFAGEPVRLAWLGAPGQPWPVAEARGTAEPAARPVPLALARDPRDPARGRAVYFPAQPGWHEVKASPSGAALAFHVLAPDALPGLRAGRRRDATAALVGETADAAGPAARSGFARTRPGVAAGAWFVLLVAGLGVWWWERRR